MFLRKSKRFLAFTLLLAMLLSILPPVTLAADTYTLATELKEGDKVLFVYAAGSTKKEFASMSTSYGAVVDYGSEPAGNYPLEVVAGASAGTWAFKTPDGSYLEYHGTSNSLYVTDAVGASSSWTVSFSGDDAIINNAGTTARYLQYNTSSPRFACYKNTQKSIQIYKLETGSEEPGCEHVNTEENTTAATCTEAGRTVVTCTVCGEIVSTTEIPATGHNYEDGVCKTCGELEPEVASYKLITLDDVKEGNYIIAAVRGGEYPAVYPATSKISGDWTVSDTDVTAVEDVITADLLPEDAQIFVLSGDNTNGFTVGMEVDGEMQYLGYTAASNRKLAFGTEYSSTLWTVIADPQGGFALSCVTGEYTISQNSTGATAIRGYANTTVYNGIYLFAEVQPEGCKHENKNILEEVKPTCQNDGYRKWSCDECGESGEDFYAASTEYCVAGDRNAIEIEDPTCSTQGVARWEIVCTLCGSTMDSGEDSISTIPHNYVDKVCTMCQKDEAGQQLSLTNQFVAGERVVLYHPASGMALSLDADSGKIVPTEVTVVDGVLTTTDNTALFTCEDNAENSYFALRTYKGLYLTSPAKGNGLSYAEEQSGLAQWYLVPVEDSSDTFKIMNAEAAYSGNKNQALEFYNDLFTVYGVKDEEAYYFQIYTLAAKEEEPLAKLEERSISLNGNIAVNFYMSLADSVVADPDAYMLFTQEGKEPVTVPVRNGVMKTVRGRQRYMFTYEVSAKEMTDVITAQFFYGDTSTEEYTYSVKTYADNQRVNLAGNTALVDLLNAMLHYGAASQLQFNYHTERLANEGMQTPDYASVDLSNLAMSKDQGTTLARFAGVSLLLKSETTLRFFFKVDPSVEEFTVTYEGQTLPLKERSGLLYVDITDISAPDLDKEITVTISDGIESAQVSYGVLAYCSSVRTNANGNHTQTLIDACAALYLYNQAANQYFERSST